MSDHQTSPLAGLLRVVFFLGVAVVGVTAVVTGVTNLYEEPSADDERFEEFQGFEGIVFEQDRDTANYNRNLGIIFGFIGIGAIALGILGLGARFNPLRSGLLGAGVSLVFAGVLAGSSGSDDWLTFVTSGLAFLTLVACSPWLEDGLPLDVLTRGASGGGGGVGGAMGGDPGSGDGMEPR
jgi:hypothetical protein